MIKLFFAIYKFFLSKVYQKQKNLELVLILSHYWIEHLTVIRGNPLYTQYIFTFVQK